jgi:hypothetical protein
MPLPLRDCIKDIHKVNSDGSPATFHIVFFTSDGKRIELPAATRCGLPPALRGNRELIGIRPNIKGRHDYAVHQKLITRLNNIDTVY